MSDIIRDKIEIEELVIVVLPNDCTLKSLCSFVARLLNKYPANASIKYLTEGSIRITYTRVETDEEYVIRKTKWAKHNKFKYASNVRDGIFKLVNRKSK